jgi:hypothetical protein
LATRQVYIGFGELQGMQMTLTDISTEEVPGVHFFEGEVQITPST